MGKVVKYCGACEEGFAEKFGFCPNCGGQLQAFEMNPLGNKPAEAATTKPVETVEAAAPVVQKPEPVVEPVAAQSFTADAAPNEPAVTQEAFEFSDEIFEEPVAETKP